MMDIVDRTLKNWRATAFEWESRDCLMSIANYVLDVTGKDWGAPYRGAYSDEAGALVLIEKHGGETAMLDRTGLVRADLPERGDILLIDLGRPFAALCTGPGAVVRMTRGVREFNLNRIKIIAAWKVPQCQS